MDVPLGFFPKNGGPRDTLWTPGKFLVLSLQTWNTENYLG